MSKIMKDQINKYVEHACQVGLDNGVAGGVSAAVSVQENGVRHQGFFHGGTTRLDRFGVNVNSSTLYDLASLTKPLCTTLCILALVNEGKLNLTDSLGLLIADGCPEDKKKIQLYQLLNHSSGLPAYIPYFSQFSPVSDENNKKAIYQAIFEEPLASPPGEACFYSDLGFIVLGMLVEKSTSMRLDEYYKQVVTSPLNLSNEVLFLPVNGVNNIGLERIAATEYCDWRGYMVHGEVHDEHCWLMGGVAGHAGLFGTLRGVLGFCEYLLDAWKGRVLSAVVPNALIRKAMETKHHKGNWCLGFDTPTVGKSSSGVFFSQGSVGHLGFSGTSFWIDTEKEIVIVLLTNRIHPSRKNEKIRQFRPFFHNYLMERLSAKR